MAHAPRVSIGLPVFNGESYLEEALNSLLAQTYTDFELIISDNASTDRTQSICKAYAAKDNRIQYHQNDRNRGASWNMNRVVTLSRGEYFKWAAHDDICAPTYLERCVRALDEDPQCVLCYSETILIDEHSRMVAPYLDRCDVSSAVPNLRFRDVLEHLGLSNPMFGTVRSDALRRTKLIQNFVGSDIVLIAELALAGTFYRVPERLFLRRDHPRKSNRANSSMAALATWYSGRDKEAEPSYHWTLFRAHLASVRRVRMSAAEKLRCSAYMVKWLRWNWKDMKTELVTRGWNIAARSQQRAKAISERGISIRSRTK